MGLNIAVERIFGRLGSQGAIIAIECAARRELMRGY